jgi:hypothetical protein
MKCIDCMVLLYAAGHRSKHYARSMLHHQVLDV